MAKHQIKLDDDNAANIKALVEKSPYGLSNSQMANYLIREGLKTTVKHQPIFNISKRNKAIGQ